MVIKTSFYDNLWSIIGVILSMSANLILLPFILYFLNDDSVGLYYVFMSLGTFAGLFDFGFSPSISRNIAYAWSGARSLTSIGCDKVDGNEPNFLLIKKILKACSFIYTILSGACLFLLLTLGTYYLYRICNLGNYQYLISWGVYALAIFLNIKFSYYVVCLRGIGAVAQVNKAMVIAKVIQLILSVTSLFVGFGLLGISVSYLLYGIIFRFWAHKYFNEETGDKLKNIELNKLAFKVKEILQTLWPNTWRESLVTFSNYFTTQFTVIVASLYLPLSEVGEFSLTLQLTTAISIIASSLYISYQPELQSAYANKNKLRQGQIMAIIISTYIFFYFGGFLLFIAIKPIILLLKPTYTLSLGVISIMGIYQFIIKLRDCYCSFISTTNRLSYYRSFIISSFIGILLQYIYIEVLHWGIYGLIGACLISQLLFNAWYWPFKVNNELNIGIRFIFKEGSLQVLNWVKRTNNI